MRYDATITSRTTDKKFQKEICFTKLQFNAFSIIIDIHLLEYLIKNKYCFILTFKNCFNKLQINKKVRRFLLPM